MGQQVPVQLALHFAQSPGLSFDTCERGAEGPTVAGSASASRGRRSWEQAVPLRPPETFESC